jgi:hypothetical protein
MDKQTDELLFDYLSQYEKDDPVVREILALRKEALLSKTADTNPMENSFWESLIDGALKGLNVVALASFDWRLLTISKLLEVWIKDKREERQKKQQDLTLGKNYDITHPNFTVSPSNPYGQGSYY